MTDEQKNKASTTFTLRRSYATVRSDPDVQSAVQPTLPVQSAVQPTLPIAQISDSITSIGKIRIKRKHIEHNVKLASVASNDMSTKLKEIKAEYDEIKALEVSLESRKKRLKRDRDHIVDKLASYADVAGRYDAERKECNSSLVQLTTVVAGFADQTDMQVTLLKQQIDREKDLLMLVSSKKINDVINEAEQLKF